MFIKNVMRPLPPKSMRPTGFFADAVRFVTSTQLMDASLWRLFVDQFRLKSDAEDTGWRGEYWGKMMRGGAMTYAYTGDQALYDMLRDSVLDLLSTQEKSGRVSTYDDRTEFSVFLKCGNWDMWGRKYVMLGLLYFLEICREKPLEVRITEALIRHADYILQKVGPDPGKTDIAATSRFWGGMNSCSVLEPFVKLYARTGCKRYLDFSAYIVRRGGSGVCNLFELAYEDKRLPYQYPVTKA